MRQDAPAINDFPFVAKERIRYSDMDAHGHVNNAVYLTYLEAARIAMVQEGGQRLLDEGCQYVVARLSIDFRHEIVWPGEVELGIRLRQLGRSSFTMEQAIFQNGICTASAETVMVQTSKQTRKSQAFSEALRAGLAAHLAEE